MRAVNLIPDDLRKGGTGGRTGNAVYFLLGGLAVAVALVAAWALAGAQVTEKRNELAQVKVEAAAAEARAGKLDPYAKFASMADKRVETVSSLARNRFNWPYALREVSRTLPKNVWLTTMVGTVAPGVQVSDVSAGSTASLRNALAVPAIELVGCSSGQNGVAEYLARLRSVEGVTRASLSTSEKTSDGGGAGGAGGGSADDCRQGNTNIPKFVAGVFFERSTATASAPTPGAAPAADADAKGDSK